MPPWAKEGGSGLCPKTCVTSPIRAALSPRRGLRGLKRKRELGECAEAVLHGGSHSARSCGTALAWCGCRGAVDGRCAWRHPGG